MLILQIAAGVFLGLTFYNDLKRRTGKETVLELQATLVFYLLTLAGIAYLIWKTW